MQQEHLFNYSFYSYFIAVNMKKLFYTFMSVIALCEFVPTSAFAQKQYDLETAQPDTTKQNYHLIDGVEISTVRKLV